MRYRLFKIIFVASFAIFIAGLIGCDGGKLSGYSDSWLYPEDISSVYVEMFDNKSFRRGLEYELTDAIAKRIEAETPYKIISDRDRADTIIRGQIVSLDEVSLSGERDTGRPMERQAEVRAVVSWENLQTGELLVDSQEVSASMSFSQWQEQSFEYASAIAANRLADRIVELMQKSW